MSHASGPKAPNEPRAEWLRKSIGTLFGIQRATASTGLRTIVRNESEVALGLANILLVAAQGSYMAFITLNLYGNALSFWTQRLKGDAVYIDELGAVIQEAIDDGLLTVTRGQVKYDAGTHMCYEFWVALAQSPPPQNTSETS